MQLGKPSKIPSVDQALPGRETEMMVSQNHFVNGNPIKGDFPEQMEAALLGLGCFWGAERKFWEIEGVYSTAVGYSAGHTKNANYEEVCSGMTGHNEVVLVIFDPKQVSYLDLLKIFWQSHNPTQGMRQGNDTGTQYRSGIYTYSDQQMTQARESKQVFQKNLSTQNLDSITTEIIKASKFFYAEDYHQQYLAKNPRGYCGLGGLGIDFSSAT